MKRDADLAALGASRADDPLHDIAFEARAERRSPERSLFGEILDWMLAPLLLIWPLSMTATYLVAQSIADAPFDRAMEASVRVLAQQVRADGDRVTFALPGSARDLLRADDTDHVYYQAWGPRGEFLGGDRNLPKPADDGDPALGVVQYRTELVAGEELRVASMYLGLDAARRAREGAPALVQVAETREKRVQLANEIIKGVILPQFLILPIAVVLVWAGLTRGIRPLAALTQRLRSRTPDDLSPLDTHEAPEEVAPLVAAFNDMLARVSNSIRRQKRFVADAAHQMKTPLAGLRTHVEFALRQNDPVELKRSLRQLATSTERATHLINQLLALARAEGEADAMPALELLDLADIARGATTEFFDAASAKAIDLGFESPGHPVLTRANAVLLSELIKNLVDNALRYTPAEGTVTTRVRVDAEHREAVLEVEDTGPGIPPHERELVLERFYRVLGSGQDGSGLGLAIVHQIARLHDATIAIGANPRAPAATGADARWPGCLVSVTFAWTPRPRGYDD